MLLGFFLHSSFVIFLSLTQITSGFCLHLWPNIYYICATKDK